MIRRQRLTPFIGLCTVVLCAGALTACANPLEQLVQQGTQGAVEELIKQNTGADIDLNTDGDGSISFETEDGSQVHIGVNSGLPEGWPDLPLPKGEVLASTTTGDGMMVSIATTEQEAEKLVSDLERRGFTNTGSTNLGELKSIILEGSDFNLTVGWIVQEDGVNLQYLVIPKN